MHRLIKCAEGAGAVLGAYLLRFGTCAVVSVALNWAHNLLER